MALDVYKDWLGIPDGPRPPDHYQLLRVVQFEDDFEKIRKNYKKLNAHVRKYASGQYAQQSQDLLNDLAKAMLCLTDDERKLDYDRSLGREIDDRDPNTGRRPMLSILVSDSVITNDQAKEVKDYAARAGLSIRDAVVQMKFADADVATRAMASELGRAFVDLTDTYPDDAVLDAVPKTLVRRHSCLPLFEDDGNILVACADEPTTELEDEIRLRFGKPIRAVLAAPQAISQGIGKYYAPGARNEAAAAQGKSSAKATGKPVSAAAAARARKKAFSEMTSEEQAEHRNMGYILSCATVIVLANLDNWILGPMVWKYFTPDWFPFVSTLLVGPPVLYGLYNKYLKN